MSDRRKPDGRGRARELHFASGGSLAQWRGRAVKFKDRKKTKNKKAARGRSWKGER